MVVTTLQQCSVAVAQGCPRTKVSRCTEYIKSYDKDVPQQLKVLDAVDAQLAYINLETVDNDEVHAYTIAWVYELVQLYCNLHANLCFTLCYS